MAFKQDENLLIIFCISYLLPSSATVCILPTIDKKGRNPTDAPPRRPFFCFCVLLSTCSLEKFNTNNNEKKATLPTDPLPEFWGVMKKEAGATRLSGGGQQARVLQTRMVRALKSYRIARTAWAHLVVPALFRVPRWTKKHAISSVVTVTHVSVGPWIMRWPVRMYDFEGRFLNFGSSGKGHFCFLLLCLCCGVVKVV